ncbi:glycosyltransferase [Parachaetomium inaequale]|uniref:Glycosyltransferase n=1 Tax=Parachaetomium inaequale TaxID=2588326 RepID=A0AAN6PHA4_9PEZI|nr:glycosyltransferase [Parachaetomium inaequale]
MSLQTVRSPFALGDYTALSEHQEQTPDSFYDGKPVLHFHATGAKAWIPKSQRGKLPFFPADLESAPTAPENSALNGQAEENVEQKVDLFVNSRYEPYSPSNPPPPPTDLTPSNLSLFCPSAECGVSIPYQQISIHAIKTLRAAGSETTFPAVYLQLELAEGGAGDDDFDTVELTLIPQQSPSTSGATTTTPAKPEATLLFDAISECSNLNPDPVQDGDDEDGDEEDGGAQIIFEGDHEAIEGFSGVFAGARDGGLPPAMPGSGGWITAENVHEYFDEEGNWIGEEEEGGGGELGEGAGAVHSREEEEGGVNGEGEAVAEGEGLRPLLGLALAVFVFLWLVLPYDNAVRLAFRWNAKRLKAALLPRPSERWVYSHPEHPVDLGQDVVVIVKTGYGTRERVPAWLDALSSLNEFKDILIIADSEGDISFTDTNHEQWKLHVHDAVAYSLRLHLHAYGDHPRVAQYNQLAEAIYKGDEELDAMKFISGLEMAYQQYPHKRWYLLVDDDTFIIQPSLKPLLEHLDPEQPHYLGNAVGDFKARFAHGGSAVILSHAAMRALIVNQRSLASIYVDSLDETWGDRLLAKALLKIGIYLDETYSHLFNGEPPLLSKIRADRLCSPLVSFHKLPSPSAMREVGDYFRNVSKPVMWDDLWEIYGQTPPWRLKDAGLRHNWDHVGEPDESTLTIRNVKTAEECEKHFNRRSRASLAWSWDSKTGSCHISHWMIVGKEVAGHVSAVNIPRARSLETNCIQY